MAKLLLNPETGLWENNAIMSGRAYRHRTPMMEGTLSIKTVLNGTGTWTTPDASYTLEENRYLVLNHGQLYRLDIDSSGRLTETFCVFFKPGYVEELKASLTIKNEALLEAPYSHQAASFYERLNPCDDRVIDRVKRLEVGILDPLADADSLLIDLASELLYAQGQALRGRERISSSRASTREELYGRLNLARDFMMSNLAVQISLEDAAAKACLSPFHFHRLFREAFRQTPQRFVSAQRLQLAKRLLLRTRLSVQEVCVAVGMGSVPSFITWFKKGTGHSPAQFRKIG